MTIEGAFYDLLSGATDVTDYTSTRIYPDIVDHGQDNTLPHIVIQRVSDPHTHEMKGAAGITHPRMQVDVFAESSTQRSSVAEAVRNALDGFTGTEDSTVIQKCFLQNRTDVIEDPVDKNEDATRRAIMDFEVSHFESVPAL